MPTLHVVAGPNGCGKSTLTRTTWFSGVEVIDPDAIARDTMAGNPAEAARSALRRRQAALTAGKTLVVETTLAGSGILRFMKAARTAGYRIVLHYVSVNSADQAVIRIRRQGGVAARRSLARRGATSAQPRRAVRLHPPCPGSISRPPAPAHPLPSHRSTHRRRLGQEQARGTVIRDTRPSGTGPSVREARR